MIIKYKHYYFGFLRLSVVLRFNKDKEQNKNKTQDQNDMRVNADISFLVKLFI